MFSGYPGIKSGWGLCGEAIVAERECCPFLTFELTAQPNMGPVSVRVTGPAGTKEFLKIVSRPMWQAFIRSRNSRKGLSDGPSETRHFRLKLTVTLSDGGHQGPQPADCSMPRVSLRARNGEMLGQQSVARRRRQKA